MNAAVLWFVFFYCGGKERLVCGTFLVTAAAAAVVSFRGDSSRYLACVVCTPCY